MIRSWTIVIIALSLVCSLPAAGVAQDSPPKELALYKAYVGKWACDNKALGEGAHAFKGTFEFKEEFPNVWIGRYQDIASPEHPTPGSVVQMYSFDPKSKRYTRVSQDNTSTQLTWSSSEFTDKYPVSFVWEAEGVRMPIATKTANEWLWGLEVKDGEKWTKVVEGTCKKQ